MNLKDFLDYLCGAGFAYRVEVAVRVEGERYPRCVPKNSTFFESSSEYTISIPKVLQDATRVSINYAEKNHTTIPSYERRVASSVYGFLTAIDRYLEGEGYTQKGGVVFTSRYASGRNTTKNKAEYVDSRPVDMDYMMAAMGAFGSIGSLDLAWALYYMKEMMSLLDEQAMSLAPKEQEIRMNKRNPQKRKRTTVDESSNEPKSEPKSEPSSQPSERKSEEFKVEDYDPSEYNRVVKDSIGYQLATDTTRLEDGSPDHYPGDTIAEWEIKIFLGGAHGIGTPRFHSPDSLKRIARQKQGKYDTE